MIRIFIAYSSKDLVFKDEIRKRLRPLQRAGKVEIWDNYDIEAGKDWDSEVKEKLANSDLILLLLSPDALDSEYFYEVEAPIALARHQAGDAIAVGVLLRPCSFRHTPFEFGKYELLPKKGYPITDVHWHNADEAYLTIFEEVDVLVERIMETRRGNKKPTASVSQESVGEPIVQVLESTVAQQFKNGQVTRDLPESPEMIFVEGGRFVMGSNEDENAKPPHPVTVPSFWMGKYPVTFDEYDAFCAQTGKEKPADEGLGRGRKPVINVTWEDAQAYCKWLSRQTGAQYRLPSEAEWEFAARGGTASKGFKYSGSNNLDEVGWYRINSEQTPHPVGEKKANEIGLQDMSGNVWEWCQDSWHHNYKDAPEDGSAWLAGGTPASAILRGGSWVGNDDNCHSAYREAVAPSKSSVSNGFRVARDL